MRSVSPVRVPSLQAGELYDMMVWTSKRSIAKSVRFCYFFNGTTGTVSEKIPQINKMHSADRVQLVDANGVPFLAEMRDACLVNSATGRRLTFSRVGSASQIEEAVEAVAEEPVAVEPVADASEGVAELVVDAKLLARREKDRVRKAAARAAAKAAKLAA